MAAQQTISKPELIKAIDTFQKKHGLSDPAFGAVALNDSGFMTRLRVEGKTFRQTTAQAVLKFMKAYKPGPTECPTCKQPLPQRIRLHHPDFCKKTK